MFGYEIATAASSTVCAAGVHVQQGQALKDLGLWASIVWKPNMEAFGWSTTGARSLGKGV